MSESFNPYQQWLGVPSSADRPPNHYELLGVAPSEADPQAILSAARAELATVRGIRPGENLPAWRRIPDA